MWHINTRICAAPRAFIHTDRIYPSSHKTRLHRLIMFSIIGRNEFLKIRNELHRCETISQTYYLTSAINDSEIARMNHREPLPSLTIRDDVRDNSTSAKVTIAADRVIKHRAVSPKATEPLRVVRNINLSGVLRSDRARDRDARSRESSSLSLSLSPSLWSLSFYYRARALALFRDLGILGECARDRRYLKIDPHAERERCIIALSARCIS